jgi:hypothetical protein
MSRRNPRRVGRREALRLGAAGLAALAAFDTLSQKTRAQAMVSAAPAERLCFVFGATGGGSITDSFLPVTESEVAARGGSPDELICYESRFVVERPVPGLPGSPHRLRALDLPFVIDPADPDAGYRLGFGGAGTQYRVSRFLDDHLADVAVMAMEGTSVNHFVAQTRAVTGAGIDGGRHLGERVAETYGQTLVLPFVNMATGGFLEPGSARLPSYARGETVVQPQFFALGTDALRGMVAAPGATSARAPVGDELLRGRALMARARRARDALDGRSVFGQTFQCSPLLRKVLADRRFADDVVEPADLISKLFFLTEVDPAAYGLALTEGAAALRLLVETMPDEGLPQTARRSCLNDPFLAQVLLAYLLARHGFSASVCLGLPFSADVGNLDVNLPLSFDFSHQNHVMCQALMWSRLLDGVHKLITLLQQTPVVGGGTLWDRSLIYVASDFGRDKVRAVAGQPLSSGTSTGHHLNNGALLVSPLLRGGRRYGGIDAADLLTHGFDPVSGDALPGTVMREGHVYSAVCQALGIAFPGQIPMDAMMRPGS